MPWTAQTAFALYIRFFIKALKKAKTRRRLCFLEVDEIEEFDFADDDEEDYDDDDT